MKTSWSPDKTTDPLKAICEAVLHANRDLLITALKIDRSDAWREACERVLDRNIPLADRDNVQCLFVEFGHRIRERISDDQLMTKLLRRLLPPYTGEDIQLFRGENSNRYRQDQIGFCWTPKREVAEMFASGLNAMVGDGGVLLSSVVKGPAIIAGPNSHSRWLGEEEYWVSPAELERVVVVGTFSRA